MAPAGPLRCSQCPMSPFATGEFAAKKLCVRTKRKVARATLACDAGKGRMLFQAGTRRKP